VVSVYIDEIAEPHRSRPRARTRDVCTQSQPRVRGRAPHAGRAFSTAFAQWRRPVPRPAA
jgi:hypothetical protein